MKTRPLHLTAFLRAGEGCGFTRLQFPFADLWKAFANRFLQDSLRQLAHHIAPLHLDDFLEKVRLGPDALSLSEWFDAYSAPKFRVSFEQHALIKLAEAAEDLSLEDGAWKATARDLDRAAQDTLTELEQRLANALRQALTDHGPEQAGRFWNHLQKLLAHATTSWQTVETLTAHHKDELAHAARALRAYAQPRGLMRVVKKIRPNMSTTWWLTESQRRAIAKQLLPKIEQAAGIRHRQEVLRRKRAIAKVILGTPGVPGQLDHFNENLERSKEFFLQLAEKFQPPVSRSVVTGEPHEILLVRDLDTVLQPGSKRTLGHLYQEAADKAGCTPAAFATHLHQQGLLLRGRTYQPGEWPAQPVALVEEALHKECDRYLGIGDPQAPIDIDHPKGAFEHVAAITPVHHELEGVVKHAILPLIRQSRPYVETHDVSGDSQKSFNFLFCYPTHRKMWEKRLETHLPLVSVADSAEAQAYRTIHPYVVEIAQYRVTVPLGALKNLPRWLYQSHKLRRTNIAEPLHDPAAYPEVRVLPARPDEFADTQQLFAGACLAKVIMPLTPTMFTFADSPASVEELFAPAQWTPAIRSNDFFHRQLRRESFLRAAEAAFSSVSNLGAQLRWLAREEDARKVGDELVKLGVLQAAPAAHHYQLQTSHCPEAFPRECFTWVRGPRVGLTQSAFLGELHKNDDLYNAVFWRLADAYSLGFVSVNDLTSFLRDLAAQW